MLIFFRIFTPPQQAQHKYRRRHSRESGNPLATNLQLIAMTQTIQIQDILNTIPNCNFSKEAQIELLQIVRYITLVKEQPDNICEILEQKIQILQHPDTIATGADRSLSLSKGVRADATTEPAVAERSRSAEASLARTSVRADVACVKVKSVAILELLNTLNAGTAHNDMSKISKLIAFLTGNSYHRIYNELQKGILFSDFHTQQINEINKIFSELNIPITINPTKEY